MWLVVRWHGWYMNTMKATHKATKAADHGTKVFWVRAIRGEQQGNCPGQVLKPPSDRQGQLRGHC